MQVWAPSPQGSALTTPLSFPVSVICVFPFFFFLSYLDQRFIDFIDLFKELAFDFIDFLY